MVGDQILNTLCWAIEQHIKRAEAVGRWGGEEFIISLPGATGVQALLVAQRIGETMASLQVMDRDQKAIPVPTVSGASQFTRVKRMRSTSSSTWRAAASMLQKNEVEIRLSPISVTGEKVGKNKKYEQKIIYLIGYSIQRLSKAYDRFFDRIIVNLVMCDKSKATIIFRIHQYPKFSHLFRDLL